MSNPTMVYIVGTTLKHDGNIFDYKIVEADVPEGAEGSELDAALADGWYRTPAEALEGVPSDDAAPTREELKTKADELNLEYPGNISTKKLAELVYSALGE